MRSAMKFIVVLGILLFPVLTLAQTTASSDPAKILTRGTMAQAAGELREYVEQHPDDDNARFALGIAQTLGAVERLAGSMHHYGLRDDTWTRSLPFFRIPVPEQQEPQPIGYDDARKLVQDWLDDMQAARQTLADIRNPADVKLRLPVGMMHLDLNGDGTAAEEESLWMLFATVNPGANIRADHANDFIIALDGGDVHWLHGYCHLLSAMPEMVLAYDGTELFNATGHMFFKQVRTPHEYLNQDVKVADFGAGVDIVDAVAFVHLLNLPVTEPQRMQRAHEHLRSMLEQSRKSWDLILAETDDEREWIPNPRQSTVIPNMRVTQEMVDGWMTFLDEAGAVLDGQKLIPFWRSADGRGVNLKRVFTEPTRFDLVLWVQGTAATPYLEKGELTTPEVWRRLQRTFAGEFFTFALWFN